MHAHRLPPRSGVQVRDGAGLTVPPPPSCSREPLAPGDHQLGLRAEMAGRKVLDLARELPDSPSEGAQDERPFPR